jgi:hypothetical protein
MNRRDLFPIGAAAALLLPPLDVASGQTGAAAAGWQPSVFDAHQNNTVIALTELIIPRTDTPGARDALVNRYLDLLLRDGEDAPRREFLAGLSWLDGYALRRSGKPFVALTAAEQTAILKTLDAGKEEGVGPGQHFFRSIKTWTSRIYYATEIGFKELNKGGRVPASYGCPHPDQPA